MKRVIALVISTLALAACSTPTAPTRANAAKAKATLHGATKANTAPSARLASN